MRFGLLKTFPRKEFIVALRRRPEEGEGARNTDSNTKSRCRSAPITASFCNIGNENGRGQERGRRHPHVVGLTAAAGRLARAAELFAAHLHQANAKEPNKAATATPIRAVPIQPNAISQDRALKRPIAREFETITIIIVMIGTATMPLSTALHTSMWIASMPVNPSPKPMTVAAAMIV